MLFVFYELLQHAGLSEPDLSCADFRGPLRLKHDEFCNWDVDEITCDLDASHLHILHQNVVLSDNGAILALQASIYSMSHTF